MKILPYRHIYINGIQTDYLIYINGMIRLGDKCIDSNILYIGDKQFKVDPLYLVANAFLANPNCHNSVQNNGRLEWYTNKGLIEAAISEEMEFSSSCKTFASEEDTIRYACNLMQNPEVRLPYVSNLTGLSGRTLRNIRTGDEYNDIAKDYIFPICNSLTINRSYSESQIHDVCKMLSQEICKIELIERMTNVTKNSIMLIRARELYPEISMYYEFPYVKNSYTVQQLRHVCFMLESRKYQYKEISEFCKVDMDTIFGIRDKHLYVNISNDFDLSHCIDDAYPYTERVLTYIHNGMSSREIVSRIQLEYNVPDRKEVQLNVADIKRRYLNNAKGSTTIRKE